MLASSLEHEALVNHFANDDVPYKSLLFQAAREKIRLPDDEDIQRALRVCDLVVSKLKDADPLRAFVETHARIQALSTPAAPPAGKDGKGAPQGGLKELDMDDASLKELAALVVAGINMVGEPGASDAEKAHAIGTAAMALSKTEERTRSGTDVEMWTKLGQAALLAGMPSESVQCCKHTMSILPANVKVDEIDMKEVTAARWPRCPPRSTADSYSGLKCWCCLSHYLVVVFHATPVLALIASGSAHSGRQDVNCQNAEPSP